MAKWGEGDPRWIVEERPDAVNVNNWHWTEKNATPWSKDRIKQLLCQIEIEKGAVTIKLTEIQKLEGEATANNRKAKLIFLFEWDIKVKLTARVAGSDIEYEGYVEIPNLSDENTADEIDVTTTIDTKGPHEAEIRYIINGEGTTMIRKQLAIYIRELKEEFSKGLILPTDKSKSQVVVKSNSNLNKKSFQNQVTTSTGDSELNASASETIEMTTINIKESLKAPPDRVFQVLTVDDLVRKWSNSKVSIDLKEGGQFSLFDGMVCGTFTTIIPYNELKMKWRLKSYPQGHFANVKFVLIDQGDCTELQVTADGVPKRFEDETRSGLERYYIQNIMRTFGFGARLY